MKKMLALMLALMCSVAPTVLLAAEPNLVGDWTLTFQGYYGNDTVGVTYGQADMTLHITAQTGGAFAGNAVLDVDGSSTHGLITGVAQKNELHMVWGGNNFIHGTIVNPGSRGKMRLKLIMETQQMSDADTQGVLYGTGVAQ
ncbi:hypothetical protein [Thiobaca trueperi]|uniref:Uncharacterized protein n=1 Tax=Thiobaca trueperi TaxID=127458 RepID=A0A4R3N1U9_9GAMM|nr:hypothetical protein [Thiobaca trueperi]TCT21906.1 hypothetical protein EDC35_1034 [Thiobaca trueperi]